MPKVYLLSRALDPILGIFTGLLAYHMSEANPRSNILPGHTLRELVPWQWNRWKAERRAVEAQKASSLPEGVQGDVDWEKVTKELEGAAISTKTAA